MRRPVMTIACRRGARTHWTPMRGEARNSRRYAGLERQIVRERGESGADARLTVRRDLAGSETVQRDQPVQRLFHERSCRVSRDAGGDVPRQDGQA